MKDITLRERFEIWKQDEYTHGNDTAQDLYSFWDFIESEIANARKEMKDRCMEELKEYSDPSGTYFFGYNAAIQVARKSIQSLN